MKVLCPSKQATQRLPHYGKMPGSVQEGDQLLYQSFQVCSKHHQLWVDVVNVTRAEKNEGQGLFSQGKSRISKSSSRAHWRTCHHVTLLVMLICAERAISQVTWTKNRLHPCVDSVIFCMSTAHRKVYQKTVHQLVLFVCSLKLLFASPKLISVCAAEYNCVQFWRRIFARNKGVVRCHCGGRFY